MADPKGPKDKKDPRKPAPEDFEKTVFVDTSKMDDKKKKPAADARDGFEETVMVRLPEGDFDFAETEDFFDEEERTGDHVVETTPSPEPEKPAKAKGKEKAKEKPAKETPAAKEAPPAAAKKPETKKEKPAKPPPPVRPSVQDESSYTMMSQVPVDRPKISLLYLALAMLFFLVIAESAIEVLSRGIGLRLAVSLALIAGIGILALLLLRRIEGRAAFLWMVAVTIGLVAHSGYYYFTSDTEALTVFKHPLSVLLGPLLTVAGLIVTVNLWQRKRYPMLAKLLSGLALLLLLLGYGFALMQRTSLEGSFWGPAFLIKLPLFLRPGILALGLAFPLDVLAVLIALLLVKTSTKGKFRRFGIPLLIMSLAASLLGLKLLARQGVAIPAIGDWLSEPNIGITMLDPVNAGVQLKASTGSQSLGKERERYLQMAVSRSVLKGKDREAILMVKNGEGRSMVGSLEGNLVFSRGDKPVKGGKASLQLARLGERKSIYVIPALPSASQLPVKTLLAGSLIRLAQQLSEGDHLYVGAATPQTLNAGNPGEWESMIGKAIAPAPVDLVATMPAVMKKLAADTGLKQAIVLVETPPSPQIRESLLAGAKNAKVTLSFVVLGASSTEADPYGAADISALGFELLAASAETLGQYTLQFPNLPPLPQIKVARDAAGQVNLSGGRIAFEVSNADPAAISKLELKVDEEKPVDLGNSPNQAVDLARFKVKPGNHRFTILLTTTGGDVVSESFDGNYAARRPLRFAKPMDRDTLSGVVNILLSPGRGVSGESGSIDILVDGAKVGGATAEPYLVPLDTKTLSEGDHVLQAVQTFADGSTETFQIQVKVNQQVPQVKVVRPSIGEYLSNLAEIEAQIGGGLFEQVQKVEFFVDGEWIGESPQAPYRFLWSNNAFPAGKYYVQARATLASQAMTSDAVEIQLGQGEVVVQADPNASAGGMLFPDNVEILIDASASMREPVAAAFKIDLTKFAVSALLENLPQNVKLQTRVFGGESFSSQQNCSDTALLKNVVPELEALQARGTSPLGNNLKMLAQDLKKASGSRVAILITDGWDKCNVDPLEIASALAKSGTKLRLHIIYFSDIDPAAESLLKKLAEVLGGQVFRVKSQDDMMQAMRKAIQVSFSLFDYKNTPVVSQPLSKEPFVLRSGDYRLEIDTSPPLTRDKVTIPTGARKSFTVLPANGQFDLREE